MALVTATVTVDFIANYAGSHRVCWTVQGSGDPYDCTTLVNCVGGGTTCQAIFTADVNTTSCDGTVTFEGYVQAACEDINSLNGRLPFTVDFVPNPICNRYELTCNATAITGFTINDGGRDYLVGDAVVITRAIGDLETVDAIISINAVGTGVINSVTGVLSAGTGYTALDVIDVDVLAGPGCTGSGATIRVDTIGGGGEVLTYTLLTGGTLYNGCTFSFSGGTGVGVFFDIIQGVDYDPLGMILSFTITNGGLYDTVPTISITTGTGQDFDGTVLLADCGAWNALGTDCDGNVVNLASGLPQGDLVAVCVNDTGLVAQPTEYTSVESGCCIPADTVVTPTCVDYHIENLSGGPENVQYTSCDGIVITVAVPDTTTVPVCAIIDGVLDPQVAGLTITTSMAACGA